MITSPTTASLWAVQEREGLPQCILMTDLWCNRGESSTQQKLQFSRQHGRQLSLPDTNCQGRAAEAARLRRGTHTASPLYPQNTPSVWKAHLLLPFFFFLWLVQIFLSSCLRNLVADCTAEEDFDSFANIFCPSFGEVQRTACLGLQTFPLLKSATLLTQTCHQKQAFISIICSIILKILVVAVNVFSPGISKSNYFLLYD